MKEIKHKRNLIVTNDYVGNVLLVHNGRSIVKVTVEQEIVGMKLGEIVKTRRGRPVVRVLNKYGTAKKKK